MIGRILMKMIDREHISHFYVDAVISNPPYSQPWNPNEKETDPRYAEYGLAPEGKS